LPKKCNFWRPNAWHVYRCKVSQLLIIYTYISKCGVHAVRFGICRNFLTGHENFVILRDENGCVVGGRSIKKNCRSVFQGEKWLLGKLYIDQRWSDHSNRFLIAANEMKFCRTRTAPFHWEIDSIVSDTEGNLKRKSPELAFKVLAEQQTGRLFLLWKPSFYYGTWLCTTS